MTDSYLVQAAKQHERQQQSAPLSPGYLTDTALRLGATPRHVVKRQAQFWNPQFRQGRHKTVRRNTKLAQQILEDGDSGIQTFWSSEIDSWAQAVEEAYNESIPGIALSKELPEPSSLKALRHKFLKESVLTVLELPIYLSGALPGMFMVSPAVSLAGASAAPMAIRQWLMDEYSNDPAISEADLSERLGRMMWEGTKGGAAGLLTGAVGGRFNQWASRLYGPAVGRLATLPVELGTMTTAHSLLVNGQLPTSDDFQHAAIALAAGHAVHRGGAPVRNAITDAHLRTRRGVAAKLSIIYAETGMHPDAVLRMSRTDPILREQLVSRNPEVPDQLRTRGPREKVDSGERPPLNLKDDVRTFKNGLEDALVDDLGGIRRFVDDVAGTGAWTRMDASTNSYKIARTARGYQGKVEHFMEQGGWNIRTGETDGSRGLMQILKDVHNPDKGTSLVGFGEYMVARHAKELEARFTRQRSDISLNIRNLRRDIRMHAGDPVRQAELTRELLVAQRKLDSQIARLGADELTGFRRYDLDATINEGRLKYASSLTDWRTLNDSLLTMTKDAGFISKVDLRRIQRANKDYIPYKRLMEESYTRRGTTGAAPLHPIKGSGRPLTNVWLQYIDDLQRTLRAIEHNEVVNSMARLDTGGRILRPTRSATDARRDLATARGVDPSTINALDLVRTMNEDGRVFIHAYQDGTRQSYEVPKDIAHSLANLTGRELQINHPIGKFLWSALKFPATVLRGAAVSTPEFMFSNMSRDISSAFVFSKNGNRHMASFLEGAYHSIRQDDTYWRWMRAGGAMGNIQSEHLGHLRGDVYRKLIERNFRNTIDIKRVWEGYQKIGNTFETGSRLGEFGNMERHGNHRLESAYQSRDVSLDFGKAGWLGRYINDITAFHNVGIQSAAKLYEASRYNPASTAFKVMVGVTVPSVVLNLMFGDDPRVQEVQQWERDLFWIIPTEDELVRIPKPHEVGLLFGSSVERAMDAMRRDDPRAWDGYTNSLKEKFGMSIGPTIAQPVIENLTGYSFFRGRQLIPFFKEKDLPEFQYTSSTSETAKKVSAWIARLTPGQHTNTPTPVELDNLIQGWTAGMGRYVVKGLDLMLQDEDVVKPLSGLKDVPIIGAFISRYPNAHTRSITAFRKAHRKAQSLTTTTANLKKAMEFEKYKSVMGNYRWIQLNGINKQLNEVSQRIHYFNRLRNGAHGLTGRELRVYKADNIEQLYRRMIQLSKGGLAIYDGVDKQMKQE